MNPAAANSEVLTVKEVSDLLRLRPSTVLQDDQAGQDSVLSKRANRQ